MTIDNLTRYHNRMALGIATLGGKCISCNSVEKLEVDHINPQEKDFTLSQKWSTSLEIWLIELSKCQLLCVKCHKAKTAKEQKTRVHGTIAMYRREKCRCNKCVSINSQYQAKYSNKRTWCETCKKRYYKKCPTHAPIV